MSETGQINGSAALVQMTARYEALLRDFGLLGQLEALGEESLSASDACTRLVALVALEGIAEYCSIMLLDGEGSYLELRAVATRYSTQGFSLDSEVWKGKRFALSEGIAGQVAATGVHVRINDTLADPNFLRLPDSPVNVRSLLCFPLIDEGETLGVVNLSQGEPNFFSVDRERAMLLVAARMAQILGKSLRAEPQPRRAATGIHDGDLLLVRDGDGRVLQISGNCMTLTGKHAEQWVSGGERWRDHVAERDRAAFDEYHTRLSGGAPNDGIVYAFEVGPGDERQFSEYAMTLPPETGPSGRIVVVRDEGRGSPSSNGFSNHAAARLLHAQRIHTMGQLASGIVHDLNNLLTGIVGNLDLALVSNSGEETTDLIARARTASIRGTDIVNKVLNFGRAGAPHGEQVPLNPKSVIEEAADILRCSLDPCIALEVSTPETVSAIFGDAGQLHQVLVNLGVNARDALEHRGRQGAVSDWQLKIGLESIHLDPQTSGPWGKGLEGDFVRIYVSDNGKGMTPDVLARIYEPFFTTKVRGKGTGLGLSTVYRIVRHHRGWIDVASTPEKGTTFNLYFPACASEIADASAPAAEPSPGAKECVLIVDDEPLVRNLGAAILKRLGYQPLTAKDGREGIETYKANRESIDMIILDLQMPDMGGEAVLQQIRAINPHMPIVYSTGMSYIESEDLPEHLRPTSLLKKPYLIATMSEVIREALGRRP